LCVCTSSATLFPYATLFRSRRRRDPRRTRRRRRPGRRHRQGGVGRHRPRRPRPGRGRGGAPVPRHRGGRGVLRPDLRRGRRLVIGVLHAYSRTNSGDGLLVDLTLERLGRAGVAVDDVLLVALDPESFPEVPRRAPMGVRGRGVSADLVPAAWRSAAVATSAVTHRPLGDLARRLAECDALVAVGGGYLRAVDLVSSVGTALNHLPQLVAAGHSGRPTLYLPQSIGPLRGPVGEAVRRGLRRIDAVCVRDRWSAAELAGLPGLHQLPDLAVLDLAERFDGLERARPGGAVGFVARQVPHADGYEAVVRRVADGFGADAVWAVQT